MCIFVCVWLCVHQVRVVFDVRYISPDDAAGNFEPAHLVSPVQISQYGRAIGGISQDDDYNDQQMLLDVEQNIVNLERSLGKGF